MLNREHKEFLKTEQGRKFHSKVALDVTPENENWQAFHTPYDLCEKMISKTNLINKSILVLFNIEFLEVLIHKHGVLSKNVTFLADCRLEAEMSSKLYKVKNIVVVDDDIDGLQEILKKMKTFDLCFSNPPYGQKSQHFHLKILLSVLNICEEIVYVHPCGWLLKNKPIKVKLFQNVKNNLSGITKEFYIFNPNKVFGIDQVDPCCITHIDKKFDGKQIFVNYFDQIQYTTQDINDITVFCDAWIDIVVPFKKTMEKHISANSDIYYWSQRVTDKTNLNTLERNKFYCQFTAMQPGTGDETGRFMHGEDLYKIINPNQNYIIDFEKLKPHSQLIYWFNTENERYNFLNYLKTDFVRFCLSVYKSNQNLFDGAMCLIPVMDFTQEWSDEKLYEEFNIPQKTIEYITNFFPKDLYDLRNES